MPVPTQLTTAPATPGLSDPDLQLQLVPAAYADHGRKVFRWHGFMVHFNHLKPPSRGRLTLRSADPLAPPAIDLNMLAEPGDLAALRRGIEITRRIVSQPAFAPYRGEELEPGPGTVHDDTLDHCVRTSVDSTYHPVGTCAMGDGENAVVDPRLRVHGVTGLRVVDGSVMPALVSGKTNVPIIMIAEKAAGMVLADGGR